ncbi:MAG: ABC transporter permease [Lachnospiraceae bacterium]
MNGIKQIFIKEMDRVFKDKKMVFSVFILPVVVMIGILVIMNSLMGSMEKDIEQHKPIVYVQNQAESFRSFLTENNHTYQLKSIKTKQERTDAESQIIKGNADLLIEFPVDMEEQIAQYKEGDAIPQVKTYYNPSEDYSRQAFTEISQNALEAYRQSLLSKRVGNLEQISIFTVNTDNKEMIMQDESKAGGKALGMMLPYFITILLFAGAMGIGTDMIAGEKERGTMASLLVSPIKRSAIVLGKVCSLMCISGISSVIYVVAMVAFIPVMMKSMTGQRDNFNLNFSVAQIIMLGVLLVAVAFLYSSIIALMSVFAKTTKEAGTYVMPAYMLILIIGMTTIFTTGETTTASYCIPIYNSSVALKGILTQEITMMQYGLTVGITLLVGAILTGIMVKAFESEKVMSI